MLPALQELVSLKLLSVEEAHQLDEVAKRSPAEFLSLPLPLLKRLLQAQRLAAFNVADQTKH
jgi:hypothetical protein